MGFYHTGGGIDQVGTSRATVLLTPGNDTFDCRGESENLVSNLIIDGGAGNDQLNAGGFPDQARIYELKGGPGNDTFWWDIEAGGVSVVDGGPGNDVINDNDEPDGPVTCDGGPGYDIYNLGFHFEFLGDHEVTVPAGIEEFSTATNDNLIIHGNNLDNSITGTAANVTLYGNGGNDWLKANVDPNSPYGLNPGHALVDGGSGNDTLMGNAATVYKGDLGTDTASFSAATSNLNITLDNKTNDGATNDHANVMSDVENVIGGSGNDKITGSSANNILRGGKGNDSLYGGGGADALFGEERNDVLDGGSGDDYLQGWTGNDALFGRDGNDKLDAGDGDDYLEGNGGNDTLTGGTGRDKLYGNDGNDLLYAKDGKVDTLDGGNGTDKAQRDNTSTIKDSVLNIESFI
jgi:Ca2+-binding RTX toxin-like protein